MSWPLHFLVHSFPIGNKSTKVKKKKKKSSRMACKEALSAREGVAECGSVCVSVHVLKIEKRLGGHSLRS